MDESAQRESSKEIPGLINRSQASARLKQEKDRILQLWKERLKSINTEANALPEHILENALPRVIDEIVDELKGQKSSSRLASKEKQTAQEHASQRIAVTDFTLSEVLFEYRILREVVFQILEEDVPLTPEARDIILHTFDVEIRYAAASYANIKVELETTQKKTAQESETLLRAMLESTPIGVAFIDEDFRYVKVNPVLAAMNGIPAEAHLGKTVREVIPEAAEFIEPMLKKVLAGQSLLNMEVAAPIRNRYFLANYIPVELPGAGRIGISGWVVDITEQKQTENRLRDSEERYRIVVEGALDHAIIRMDRNGIVQEWNKGAENIFGYMRDEVIGKSGSIIFTEEDIAKGADKEEINTAVKEGSAADERWHRRKDDSRFFASGAMNVLRDPVGNIYGFIKVARDATKQQIAMESLLEERAMRERSTNTLTHDLRSPLAAAKISAQLALRHRDNQESRERLLLRIVEAIERTDRMIGDLLDANRIKAGERLPQKIEYCDLLSIVQHSIDEHALSSGNRFTLNADGDFEGYWSSEGLRRVLDNLLNNSVKYGATGTPITISLQWVNENVQLKVHNLGGELSPEEAKNLFTMYHRAQTAQTSGKRGWGIGLTLVKGIVEAHRGSVWVESGEGRGTTFIVELPKDSR